jgi:alpha-mannosidase
MRFALEHQTPLVTGAVTCEDGVLSDAQYSFLKIADPNVLLWSLKPAEEGYRSRGVIVRCWNLGDAPSTPTVTMARPMAEAYETTLVETDVEPVKFSGRDVPGFIPQQQMATYRLTFR